MKYHSYYDKSVMFSDHPKHINPCQTFNIHPCILSSFFSFFKHIKREKLNIINQHTIHTCCHYLLRNDSCTEEPLGAVSHAFTLQSHRKQHPFNLRPCIPLSIRYYTFEFLSFIIGLNNAWTNTMGQHLKC